MTVTKERRFTPVGSNVISFRNTQKQSDILRAYDTVADGVIQQ